MLSNATNKCVLFLALVVMIGAGAWLLFANSSLPCYLLPNPEAGLDPTSDAYRHLLMSDPRLVPVWSPDDNNIAFSIEHVGYTGFGGSIGAMEINPGVRIYVISTDGSNIFRVTEDDKKYPIKHSPMFSPDGSRIVYTTYNSSDVGHFEIEVSGVEGTTRSRLTEGKGLDFGAAWSPDGSQIAFARYDNYAKCSNMPTRSGAYTVDVSTKAVRKVVSIEENVTSWSLESDAMSLEWDPDRSTLAILLQEFVREDYESTGRLGFARGVLVTVGSEDSGITRLLTGSEMELGSAKEFVNHPAWSPDGKSIAFIMIDNDNRAGLFMIHRDGSGLSEVVNVSIDEANVDFKRGDLKTGSVSWSPDGSRILFSLRNVLYVVHVDGSDLNTLGEGLRASWSTDGSRIAYVSADSPGIVLHTTAADGSDMRVLAVRGDGGSVEAVGPNLGISATASSCSAGIVVPRPETRPGLVRDCESLVRMMNWSFAERLNWSAETPIAEWNGVVLDDPVNRGSPRPQGVARQSRVVGLSLPARDLENFHPAFYSELATLEELQALDLSGNRLEGAISPELRDLRKLEVLDLSGNVLNGPIPPELGDLENLKVLNLRWNDLEGTIPPELGDLKSLTALKLGSNNLSGLIPPELAGLIALETLDLASNDNLSGCPPEALYERGLSIRVDDDGCDPRRR